ncbi:MAG: cation transporter [Gemmatimonadales bacterium]|nr:MAG: cation transporter [Gemmatimonadales bacterium]
MTLPSSLPTDSRSNRKSIRRVLYLVLVANLLVAGAKLFIGWRTGSLAVLGDAAHSGFDSLNNVIALLAIRVAAAPADDEHPYGHAKFETLGALAVVSFLSITAFELVSGATSRLLTGGSALKLDTLTFALLAVTLVVNAAVAGVETWGARKLDSELLAADAHHTAADVWITLAVLGGLALVAAGWEDADSWLAIGVAGLICFSGYQVLRSTVPVLVDRRAVDAARIIRFVGELEGVREVHDVRSRGRIGSHAHAEMTVVVDENLTVADGHAIADEVERKLIVEGGFATVVVHVEPPDATGQETEGG